MKQAQPNDASSVFPSLVSMITKDSCPTCEYNFLDSDKNMSPVTKYFWLEKKDENFIENHIEQCREWRSYRSFVKCQYCQEEIQRYLKHRHMFEKHMEQMRQCEKCSQWFHKRMLVTHKSNRHKVRDKTTDNCAKTEKFHGVCSKCGDTFSDKRAYGNHLSRHSREEKRKRKIHCKKCDKFIPYCSFQRHELSHIGFEDGEARSCDQCGASFTDEVTFSAHRSAHKQKLKNLLQGPKREQCHICDKWFYAPVKNHIERVHTERQRFPCDQCQKTFSEERFLRRHMVLHTKQYLFNCRFCDKGYNVKCALEYHEDTVHTKIKRYVCPDESCGESFFVNFYLRRHLKQAHNRQTMKSTKYK